MQQLRIDLARAKVRRQHRLQYEQKAEAMRHMPSRSHIQTSILFLFVLGESRLKAEDSDALMS